MLQITEFWDQMKAYIVANVCAYLPGLELKAQYSSILNEAEIGYGWPPNPDSINYREKLN